MARRPIKAKRSGECGQCGEPFEAGVMIRWYPGTNDAGRAHTYPTECACQAERKREREGRGSVTTFEVGGKTFTRNAAGLCEDAPCCGCCTI